MDNEMVQLANGHLFNCDEWRSHASKSVYGFTGFYFCRVCYAHEFFAFIYPRVLISKLNGRKIIGSMAMRLTSKLMCARQTSDRVTLEPVLNALCFAIYRHSNKARLEGFFFFFFVLLNLESNTAERSGSQKANKGTFSFQGLSGSIRMNLATCQCKGMRFSSQALR